MKNVFQCKLCTLLYSSHTTHTWYKMWHLLAVILPKAGTHLETVPELGRLRLWKGNWKIVLCRSNASSPSLANKQRCSRHHLAAEAGRRGFEVQPVPDSHWSIFLASYWSRAYLGAEVADRGKKRRLTWHQARADGFVWKEKSWQTHGRKCVLSKLKNDNKSPHLQRQQIG